jgi:hypothetical protein
MKSGGGGQRYNARQDDRRQDEIRLDKKRQDKTRQDTKTANRQDKHLDETKNKKHTKLNVHRITQIKISIKPQHGAGVGGGGRSDAAK